MRIDISKHLKCYCELTAQNDGYLIRTYSDSTFMLKAILVAVYIEQRYDWIPDCIEDMVNGWLTKYSNTIASHNVALFIEWIPLSEFREACCVLDSVFGMYLASNYCFKSEDELLDYLESNPELQYCVHAIFVDDTNEIIKSSNACTVAALLLGLHCNVFGDSLGVSCAAYAFISYIVKERKLIQFNEMEEVVSIGAQLYDIDSELLRSLLLATYIKSVKGGR